MSKIVQFPKQKTLHEKVQLSAIDLLEDFNNTYKPKEVSKSLQKGYMQLLSNKKED